MHIQPYLFFNGRCEEAVEFYQRTVGAKAGMLLRMKDSPEPPPPGAMPPGMESKIMHGELQIGDTTLLVSDGMSDGPPTFDGFRLALQVADVATCERLFAGLAAGGQVQQAPAKTFFSAAFGMCTDRFGLPWMVLVSQP
ncbi:MAG: VOC family protein [bacterium]|nr:VOC family protein [bacterium]